jgi:RNA polymerase sigma factor (sigma-70 family)
MPDRHEARALLETHLGHVERAAVMTCRQHGVWGADAEDFVGWIQVKLVEDDYAVIRKHRGDATLKTYLATVVVRQFHEWARQRWGRWRVSAKAERLGPPAPQLETLVYRDGLTVQQAGELLRTSEITALSDTGLARLLHELPERAPLRPVQLPAAARDKALADAEAASRADEWITAADADEKRARLAAALTRAMEELSPEDRTIADMHLRDGLSVADVARALHLEQKPLYRRIERLRKQLCHSLEREGIQGLAFLDEEEEP